MPWVPTNEIVQSQIESFKNYADQSFLIAVNALQNIAANFDGGMAATHINYSGPRSSAAQLPGFVKPTPAPTAPDLSIAIPPAIGSPLSSQDINARLNEIKARLRALGAPVLVESAIPPIQWPAQPNTPFPATPDGPAPFKAPVYPTAPEIIEPILPTLRQITLPTLTRPDLGGIETLLAELRARRPVAPTLPNIPDYDTLVAHYTALTNSQLAAFVGQCPALASIAPRLTELLSGHSIGMPAAVAQSLRDRAFAAEDQQAFQAEQTALTEWQSRGFTLPSGVLAAQIGQIRQLNRDKKAQINRDLWLEEAKLEIENLRQAISQGIAYEGQLRDSWAKLTDIVRLLATGAMEGPLRLLDGAIALFKATVDSWQGEFSAIGQMLQVEISKLEQFAKELEGQKLIGTLNEQDLRLYEQQWNGVNSRIAVFGKLIDAANGLLQGELGKLNWSAKRLAAHASELGTIETQWKIFGEAARAEALKNDIRKTDADIFSSRVSAYSQQVGTEKTIGDLDIATIKAQLEAWQAQAQQRRDDLQAELARVETLAKAAGVEADVFKTKLLGETAYTDYEIKKLDHGLNVDRLTAEVAIKDADLQQSRLIEISKIALSALDGIARTGAQLSGSAMSAMNVHAGLSSSSSSSYSESHSYSHEA